LHDPKHAELAVTYALSGKKVEAVAAPPRPLLVYQCTLGKRAEPNADRSGPQPTLRTYYGFRPPQSLPSCRLCREMGEPALASQTGFEQLQALGWWRI